MLRLNLSRKPAWYDLGYGIRLLCAPVTTSILNDARHADEVEALRPKPADGEDAAPLDGRAAGALSIASAKALARAVVLDWEGIGDETGEKAEVTPDAIDALLDLQPIYTAFQLRVLGKAMLLETEKNA